MAQTLEPLIGDLVEWIGPGRPYAEVMEAWKTSCPRLPVWEEANARGLLARSREGGVEWVRPSPAGEEMLRQRRSAGQRALPRLSNFCQ